MYKVFLNDRVIIITAPGNITFNKKPLAFKNSCSPLDIKDWFQFFLENEEKQSILIHPDPEYFFSVFQRQFIKIDAAGGVVLAGNRLLFIFRNGRWDLPKGKVDAGEIPEQAALREVSEETGISGHRVVKQLPATFHIYQSPGPKLKGMWILKETHWYEMEYKGELTGVPQEEEGITEIKWIRPADLGEVLLNTYENLKQIILLYIG